MLRWRVLRQCQSLRAGGIAVAAVALAGCAIVDKYSDRAVEYNLQAEKTQTQNLILNVIRASLRRPMQFTGLTSITGTASASGSITGGYTNAHQTPYISLFGFTPPNTSTIISRTVTGTGSGTTSMSGGPTFTVPVLDTQEFYQGILQPLSPQIIDYYVKQGYPPQILFDLFVNSVDVIATDSPRCERFTFRNDVRDPVNFGQFQALADYLISSGMTTERITETRSFGPPISTSNPAQAARMVEAYSKAAEAGLEIGRDRRQARQDRPGQSLTLQKRISRYRFCFTRNIELFPIWLGGLEEQAYCGQANVRVTKLTPAQIRQAQVRQAHASRCGIAVGEQGAGDGGTSQFYDIKLSEPLLARFNRIRIAHEAGYHFPENFFPVERFRRKDVTFRFHIRSVESILYYLGEITRQNLRPEDDKPRTTQVKTSLRYGSIPRDDCDPIGNSSMRETKTDLMRLTDRRHDRRPYYCENLFVLEAGLAPDAFYSVTYDGVAYSIPSDPARAGRSLQVLELVKQLLALHTSAKQLPASSVISIVGGTAQ